MPDGPTPKQILCGLHDSVMLLAPGGWTALELKVADTAAGVRLQSIESRGEGGETPRPKPDLQLEPGLEALRLSETLEGLRGLLSSQGKAWTPGSVRIERSAEFADWKLLRDDGSPAWFGRLERAVLEQLLVTDALFDALVGSERAFVSLQGRLEAAIGDLRGFRLETAAQRLTVDRADGTTAAYRIHHVGRTSVEDGAWVWGWADDAVPAVASAAVKRICRPDIPAPGLAALWRPGYFCDEGFAWAVAGHVAVSLGARGVFRAASEDGAEVTLLAVAGD